ncbi:hypothetical protein [Jiangella endophytica]|uniref:hypothetical protein n=1 Tax=Jiangella endophytica TaxID=1623398 RepID=UPI000E3413DA|nr:hypothetical protein [Jiangella endophytica]
MSAARSGPFEWSPFGGGYLVACSDDAGRPVVDLVLPSPPDGSLRWVAAFTPAEAELLAELSSSSSSPAATAGLRDGVIALEAALRGLADGGSGGGAAADAALVTVDDLVRRLSQLRGELSLVAGPAALASSPASRPATGPARSHAADRRLTTIGGLTLALGIVAIFWVALGVLLWLLLR